MISVGHITDLDEQRLIAITYVLKHLYLGIYVQEYQRHAVHKYPYAFCHTHFKRELSVLFTIDTNAYLNHLIINRANSIHGLKNEIH